MEQQVKNEHQKNYCLSPSICKRKTVNGKSYIVRSYFAGEKDFAKAVENLAIKQAYKDLR